jgi:uncharacterized protein
MTLDATQSGKLLQLARQTIAERLSGIPVTVTAEDPLFAEPAATFVTLKIAGQLRGCIGNLEPMDSLWESVRRNALSAAFHDGRFHPLSPEELARVHIDISLLSRPEPLAYTDGDDLIARLRPGIDGVVLRHGRSGATFLPQVWEQLPEPPLFLGHLCRKAGLAENCWQREHPQVFIYQVQYFGENAP